LLPVTSRRWTADLQLRQAGLDLLPIADGDDDERSAERIGRRGLDGAGGDAPSPDTACSSRAGS
jgi:hypothetical protein